MDLSNSLPQHIAIIMDGNGRWAKAQGKPRIFGHKAGAETARSIIKYARTIGIKALSLFTFSSENWSRPQREVNFIMDLLAKMLINEVNELHANQIRLTFTGDISGLAPNLQKLISQAKERTQRNAAMTLNIVINYGGRWDILQAAKSLAKDYQTGQVDINQVGESDFSNYLSMSQLCDPDLFIRTSGECRISNFFLWQLAYTELYFCHCFWPDFTTKNLDRAIRAYQHRERRYGGVNLEEELC